MADPWQFPELEEDNLPETDYEKEATMAAGKLNRRPLPPQEEIVIERRERIGLIQADPYGSKPMIVAAFDLVGEWVDGGFQKGGVNATIVFEAYNHHFEIIVEEGPNAASDTDHPQ